MKSPDEAPLAVGDLGEVLELSLCETELLFLVLRPDRLYRFRVRSGCVRCAQIAAAYEGAVMAGLKTGDPVVLAQPWYLRGRVFAVSSMNDDGVYATVTDDSGCIGRYIGVNVGDLRPVKSVELLVTPYTLTSDHVLAYERRLPPQDPLGPESRARRDCFTATRCLDSIAGFEARVRIACAINDRILRGEAEVARRVTEEELPW